VEHDEVVHLMSQGTTLVLGIERRMTPADAVARKQINFAG
jgi:hypothetical protein